MLKNEETLWCLVCNTFLSNRLIANDHFSSNYHLERVKYLTYMKKANSRSDSQGDSSSSQCKNRKIEDRYKTPYDYIRAQNCNGQVESFVRNDSNMSEDVQNVSKTINKRPGSSLSNESWPRDEGTGVSRPEQILQKGEQQINNVFQVENKKKRGRRRGRNSSNAAQHSTNIVQQFSDEPLSNASSISDGHSSSDRGSDGHSVSDVGSASASNQSYNNQPLAHQGAAFRGQNVQYQSSGQDQWRTLGQNIGAQWRAQQGAGYVGANRSGINSWHPVRPRRHHANEKLWWQDDFDGAHWGRNQWIQAPRPMGYGLMGAAPAPRPVGVNHVLPNRTNDKPSLLGTPPIFGPPPINPHHAARVLNPPPTRQHGQVPFLIAEKWPLLDESVTSIRVKHPDILDMPTEEVQDYFSKFGEVTAIRQPKNKSDPRFASKLFYLVHFKDHSSVMAVLSKKHFLRRKFTTVAPEIAPAKKILNPKLMAKSDIYDLQSIGQPGMGFDESVEEFKSLMSEDADLHLKQEAVCRDLEQTFQHLLPGVKAKLFGSSQIGLRLKDSDTDIFMDCPNGQPPRLFVAKNANLMFKSDLYKNVLKISHARVPIITFTHVETDLTCDVTFLHKFGLKNSQMLKFVLSLDSRIRDTALLVKYWAKVHELSGMGKFSNYAVTVMVVFYFQQLDEPLVPSILTLQNLAAEKDECDGWDCCFCDDPSKLPPITNRSTTKELLLGFFDFWATFDYSKYVVCPLLGTKIEKDKFIDLDTLPPELERYKKYAITVEEEDAELAKDEAKNKQIDSYDKRYVLSVKKPFCIQDAFDLCYNITRMITSQQLLRFVWLCEYARDKVLSELQDQVLLNLFLPPATHPPSNVKSEILQCKDVYMDQIKLPNLASSHEHYKDIWFTAVRLAIVNALSVVYCMKLSVDDSNEAKAIKTSESIDSSNKLYQTLCMTAEGQACIFNGRNQTKKRLILKHNTYYNDCIITRSILQSRDKTAPSTQFSAKIRFYCFPEEVRPRLMVQYINSKASSPKYFTVFVSGLVGLFCSSFKIPLERVLTYSPNWIKTYVLSNSLSEEPDEFFNVVEKYIEHCSDECKKTSDNPEFKIIYNNNVVATQVFHSTKNKKSNNTVTNVVSINAAVASEKLLEAINASN